MKKMRKRAILLSVALALAVVLFGVFGADTALAASQDEVISEGVYMGEINLSGMTADEAKAAVNEYVEELKLKNVTFGAVGDHYVVVTAGDLGLKWENEQDIDAAVSLGKRGNIVKRYKAIQDLKHGNKVYNLSLSLDKSMLRSILEEQCTEYDVPAVNATMTRVDGQFVIDDGQTGEGVKIGRAHV